MKKIIALILSLTFCVSMVACSSSSQNEIGESSENSENNSSENSENNSSESSENNSSESSESDEEGGIPEGVYIEYTPDSTEESTEPFEDTYGLAGIYVPYSSGDIDGIIIEATEDEYIIKSDNQVFTGLSATDNGNDEYTIRATNIDESSEDYSFLYLDFSTDSSNFNWASTYYCISGFFRNCYAFDYLSYSVDGQENEIDSSVNFVFDSSAFKIVIDDIYETEVMSLSSDNFGYEDSIEFFDIPITDTRDGSEYAMNFYDFYATVEYNDESEWGTHYTYYSIYDGDRLIASGLDICEVFESETYENYLEELVGAYTSTDGDTLEVTETQIILNDETLLTGNIDMIFLYTSIFENNIIYDENDEPLYVLGLDSTVDGTDITLRMSLCDYEDPTNRIVYTRFSKN